MVTHSITYLPQTDLIIVLNEGQISELGTYSELVKIQGKFSELMETYQQDDNSDESDDEIMLSAGKLDSGCHLKS